MMIYQQPDNQTNSSQPLRFISQAVIERLRSGKFVPKRTLNEEVETSERRRSLSPLAICKRCIGYQPLVFKDRQPLLWQLVEGLNSAYTQLILVTGEPGSGKTSLLRGVAELMGGGTEQLIWFEISAYSSAASLCETILRQLVCLLESNPEVGSLPLKKSIAPEKEDPIQLQSSYDREKTFQRLEPLMANSKKAPIFLVLDDIDPFVSSQERLEAPVLKETFNFLLSQSNIKIAIASKKQPYADLKAPPQSILELHLGNFDAQTIQQIADRTAPKLGNNQTLEALFATLLKASQGKPWVVQLLCQLAKQSPETLPLVEMEYQKRLSTAPSPLAYQPLNETCPVLIEALAHWLLQLPQTQEERLILMVLSFIRHPIDEQVLKFLLPHSLPTFLQFSKKSTIKPFLRKQAEPQTVFNFLEAQLGKQKGAVSSQSMLQMQNTILFELFPALRQGILQHLSVQDKLSWHEQLDKFYNDQSLLFPQQRVFSNSDTLTLSREARFHRDKALELSNQLQAGLTTSPQAGYTTPILNNLPTAFTQSGKPILTPEEEANTTHVKGGAEKKLVAAKKDAHQKPKDAKEIELLEKITQAKQENKADTYFSTLLKLAGYQAEQTRFTEAEQTLRTLGTSLDENPLSKKLTAKQLANFQATTLQQQGEVAFQLEQPAKAMKFFQAALNQWETIISSTPEKSREAQATCHYHLMNILVKLNQETLALNHAEAIFRLFPIQQKTLMAGTTEAVQQKMARFQAESLVLQASHCWQFQQGKALEAYKQAYHLFLSIHASAEASQQLAAMGKLFWEKNDLTKTRHCFMRALQLDATHTQWEITCQNQLDFALLAWEEGYPQEALSTLEQLLALSQKQKLPLWQIKTFLAMADIVADQPGTLMQQKMYLQKAHQLGKPLLSAKGLKSVADRLDGINSQLHQSVEGISINPV